MSEMQDDYECEEQDFEDEPETKPKPRKKQKVKNTNGEQLFCPNCEQICASLRLLEIHWNKAHFGETPVTEPDLCPFCDLVFPVTSDLDLHLRQCHNSLSYTDVHPCPNCGLACKTRYRLCRHWHAVHHGEGVEGVSLVCLFCQLIAGDKEELRAHMAREHPPEEFVCPHCARSLCRRDKLTAHVRRCASNPKVVALLAEEGLASGSGKRNREEHECPNCELKLFNRSKLMYHWNAKHYGEVPLGPLMSCIFCQKRFDDKEMLQSHMEAEHPPKKFHCEFCHEEFSRKDNVTAHMLKSCTKKPVMDETRE